MFCVQKKYVRNCENVIIWYTIKVNIIFDMSATTAISNSCNYVVCSYNNFIFSIFAVSQIPISSLYSVNRSSILATIFIIYVSRVFLYQLAWLTPPTSGGWNKTMGQTINSESTARVVCRKSGEGYFEWWSFAWDTWFRRQTSSKGGTRASKNVHFSAQIRLSPIFRLVPRYVHRARFVGRRLRVSNFFFVGHRFRHIVIFSPGGDIQFHPQTESPGLCAWWLVKFSIA